MKTIQDLISLLHSTNYVDKENAAKDLAAKGTEAKEALPELRRLLHEQTDTITIGEFLQAITKIESDIPTLIKEFDGYLSDPKLSLKAAETVQNNKDLATLLLPRLWDEFKKSSNYDLGKTLVKTEYHQDKNLINVSNFIENNYDSDLRSVLLIIGIWASGELTAGNKLPTPELYSKKIWNSLSVNNDLLVINYAYWALEKINGRQTASSQLLASSIDLWKKLYIDYLYPDLKLKIDFKDPDVASIIDNVNLDDISKYYILIQNFRAKFNSYWIGNREKALEFIIDGLRKLNAGLSRILISWLNDQAHLIKERINDLILELEKTPLSEYPEEKKAREEVLEIFNKRKRIISLDVFKDWKSKDIDIIIFSIRKIIEAGKDDIKASYRRLFDTWIEWMADDRKEFVEAAMDEMSKAKESHNTIQYLVGLLSRDFSKDLKIRALITEKMIPEKIRAYNMGGLAFDQEVENELNIWTAKIKSEYGDQYNEKPIEELKNRKRLNETIDWVVNEEANRRELNARREISRRLAEMSDEALAESDHAVTNIDHPLNKVKRELKKFAVPEISKKLNTEKDTEVRENYARILGNIGGREAVDAIARAVAGEERNRAARQDLLSKYYLEPSKARSEEAAKILSDAVEEAKRTLRLLQITNTITFAVGILLLVGGVTIAVLYPDKWTKLAGALASLGGLTGVIIHLLRTPLDRIQTAMANLVQIETAFTSFIWELNLNGTYIQSQYVAEGILQDSDIAKTVDRIEGAMSLAMSLVSVYTHNGEGAKGHISSITPALTKGGTEVRIRGDHLKGVYSDKKDNGIIAIDHEPINAAIKEWSDKEVSFVIPEKLDEAEEPKTYKVSLFIDGVETNSLPLKVVPTHNGHDN